MCCEQVMADESAEPAAPERVGEMRKGTSPPDADSPAAAEASPPSPDSQPLVVRCSPRSCKPLLVLRNHSPRLPLRVAVLLRSRPMLSHCPYEARTPTTADLNTGLRSRGGP